MSKDNLVKPATKPKLVQGGPVMRWDPKTGEGKVYPSAASAPAGSLPYHPKDPQADEKASSSVSSTSSEASSASSSKPSASAGKPVLPMAKAEVIATLKSAGIQHSPNSSHSDLYNLLLASVKNGLDEAKIAYDAAETDVKKLLGLFPSS